MPVKPQSRILKAATPDILNAILGDASAEYRERVPEATRTNIRDVGVAILSTQAFKNEFLTDLVNRIGLVLITSKMYSNPLRAFKRGLLEMGETIEEIFVNIAKAHNYDPAKAETDVFKRELPDVTAVFHRLNYKNFFKATVEENDLKQAFLSLSGVTDLIAKIVEQMYTGAELDEFLNMKNLIFMFGTMGHFYPVETAAVTDEASGKNAVAAIKEISNNLTFMSDQYNAMGVQTHTAKENQILLVNSKFDAKVSVEVLSAAFNIDKVEFDGQHVLLDNFGGLANVVAILVDKDWFMVFDNMIQTTQQYNGEGLYWNYWLHVWKTFSVSPFANAVVFTSGTPAVSEVAVTPETVTLAAGASLQLGVEVTAAYYAPKSVVWSIEGQAKAGTTISTTGKLTIAADETAETITATATSTFDGTKTGACVVTVS